MDRENVRRNPGKIWATGKKWIKHQWLSGPKSQSNPLSLAVQIASAQIHCPLLTTIAEWKLPPAGAERITMRRKQVLSRREEEEDHPSLHQRIPQRSGMQVPDSSGEEDKWEGSTHMQNKDGP